MKSKHKNLIVLGLSLPAITGIISISFLIESRSQKLPAVVKSKKVYVSSLTDGVVIYDPVPLMKSVQAGDRIMLIYLHYNIRLLLFSEFIELSNMADFLPASRIDQHNYR